MSAVSPIFVSSVNLIVKLRIKSKVNVVGVRDEKNWSQKRALRTPLVISIVHVRQLLLFGHAAHLPDVDYVLRVLSLRDNYGWRSSRGRPRSSWLGRVDRSCDHCLGFSESYFEIKIRDGKDGCMGVNLEGPPLLESRKVLHGVCSP